MHVLTARVRGLPPFTREVSVDLAALSGLVAVTGDVGQGKSTLLDILAPIALYRRFSTRTSALKDRASARDCEIDVSIAHAGSVWRMLIQVDPQFSGGRGKEEAYLWRDGVALNSGKVTEFDDLVQGVRGPDGVRRGGFFPPESVFFSSAFAIQQTRAGKGSAGFFGMDVPGRKALFAYLIGLERIQELARRAGDHRKRLDAKIGDVDRDLAIEAAKVATATASPRRSPGSRSRGTPPPPARTQRANPSPMRSARLPMRGRSSRSSTRRASPSWTSAPGTPSRGRRPSAPGTPPR